MNTTQKKEILKIIKSIDFGKIIIHKQNDNITHIKKVKSIKLNN